MKQASVLKFFFGSILFLVIGLISSAQGWVADGSNTLYTVNNSLTLNPVFVGIGTNAPSAQLHTTGSVKFVGITNNNSYSRVLVQM